MDSWSRPSKSQAIPAPYYLLPGAEDTPYCHSCGRVISSRRTTAAAAAAGTKPKTPAKYCSARCRGNKPGKLDRQLEEAFVMFLSGKEAFEDTKKSRGKHVKGESRILVPCGVVERYVFGTEEEPEDAKTQDKDHSAEEESDVEREREEVAEPELAPVVSQTNEAFARFDDEGVAGIAVHDPIQPDDEGRHRSAPATKQDAKKADAVDELEEKRRQGQRKAKHKEMARCAARRGVIFGFAVEGSSERRLCEAVVSGKVVEPSYAKGDWAIRWRE